MKLLRVTWPDIEEDIKEKYGLKKEMRVRLMYNVLLNDKYEGDLEIPLYPKFVEGEVREEETTGDEVFDFVHKELKGT